MALYAITKKGVEVEAKQQVFGDWMTVYEDKVLDLKDEATTNFHVLSAKKSGMLREVDAGTFFPKAQHSVEQWAVGIAKVDLPYISASEKQPGVYLAAYVQHHIPSIGLKYYTAERAYVHSSGMVHSPVIFATKSRTAALKKFDRTAWKWEADADEFQVHRFVRDKSSPWTMETPTLNLHTTTMWQTLLTHIEEQRAREREALKEYEKQAPDTLDDATFARIFQAHVHRQDDGI